MPVTKLLIANRGEIACRIMRTCRELDVPSVAVYSDSDRGAMHVRLAIESYPIGPTPSRESYLRVDKIIDVARRSGADAVHPGYGFLAEDAEAARRIQEAGLIWVGPDPAILERMRDKIRARQAAEEAGLPVLPAIHGVQDDEQLLVQVRQMGFPVMLKPVTGRDGKGMRLVKTAAELRRALPRVKGDALFSFWDERVYIERAIVHPRHVEVQIAGDRFGNVIHLWEREGSVQRRFQQVAEEAPSPNVDADLRRRLGEAAVALGRHLGYVGVGTVEFLLDQDGGFHFLEMTCRIQGGHAVTEWITGQDLVRWQLILAAGGALPLRQEEVPLWGHAVQCRVNAEDPDRDFAPSSGVIRYLRTPAGRNLRDDNGVYPGWELSPFYAPLLSKLSAWGPERQEAVARIQSALSEYRVGGVRTNVAFHKALLAHKAFLAGEWHTGMLDHAWWKQKKIGPNLKFAVAAALFDELETEERRAQQPDVLGCDRAWQSIQKFNQF